jgi:hypothetical protein
VWSTGNFREEGRMFIRLLLEIRWRRRLAGELVWRRSFDYVFFTHVLRLNLCFS